MAGTRKPRQAPVKPPDPAPAEPAQPDPEPADKYTRCAGHVLTERGWVPETTLQKGQG